MTDSAALAIVHYFYCNTTVMPPALSFLSYLHLFPDKFEDYRVSQSSERVRHLGLHLEAVDQPEGGRAEKTRRS